MNYEQKVEIINKMEEVYDITFTDLQIDVLLGDMSVEMDRQKGKTFVIACKALLECIVSNNSINIEIYVNSKNDLKDMRDYICVLTKKMNVEYTSKFNTLTICNGTITIHANKKTLVRGASVDYLLVDNLKNTRFITGYGTTVIEVINKNGTE